MMKKKLNPGLTRYRQRVSYFGNSAILVIRAETIFQSRQWRLRQGVKIEMKIGCMFSCFSGIKVGAYPSHRRSSPLRVSYGILSELGFRSRCALSLLLSFPRQGRSSDGPPLASLSSHASAVDLLLFFTLIN